MKSLSVEKRTKLLHRAFGITAESGQKVIALAGNPNTGKSTVFNALTGLNQHTGNWPGKTVGNAQGSFTHNNQSFLLVDLPGTYSLLPNSVDEQVARDFICFGRPDVTLVVVDATALERNLNLALQVMEITDQVVLCVNLMDEAKRKGVQVDIEGLSKKLGVPVVATAARQKQGLQELKDQLFNIVTGAIRPSPLLLHYSEEVEQTICELEVKLAPLLKGLLKPRWVALRMLDGDTTLLQDIERYMTDAALPEHPVSREVSPSWPQA